MKRFEEYAKKTGNRLDLYRLIANKYHIKSAIYPGSHIDIHPSFVIPSVVYIDNFKGTKMFFKEMDSIATYIDKRKEYQEDVNISFLGMDYEEDLGVEPVDLIISQYAGFVGQKTKKYLKENGFLLCNDSHGDATLAYLDPMFELIGVINEKNQIQTTELDVYFTFSRPRAIDVEKVIQLMKGPKYKYQAQNYIFRLKSNKNRF